jgi:hypothetical protein
MDKDGRGLKNSEVGKGRREDKNSYPRPQAEVEENAHHRACQRGTRHE